MLEETAAVLVMSGATTLVAAMATSAWDGARGGALRLFGRGDAAGTAELGTQLDADQSVVVRSPEADRVREALVPFWSAQLTMLLVRHPETADELRALVAAVSQELPHGGRNGVQNITAREQGQVNAAMFGNVVVHPTAAPGSVPLPPTRGDGGAEGEGAGGAP